MPEEPPQEILTVSWVLDFARLTHSREIHTIDTNIMASIRASEITEFASIAIGKVCRYHI
ncbi:hypothetical protein VB10N_03450 [Vibrio sp. 10N]|nr:hypothetical protein VB10N_03450 [Vibrio sp. 10N]